jgi:hypothetical protein
MAKANGSNYENRFTEWAYVDLSERGIKEAAEAGKVLEENGFDFRQAYTSYLERAIKTLNLVIEEMDLVWIQVLKSWCLYGKHCGNLQGLNKEKPAENNALPPDSVFVKITTLRFKSGFIIVTDSIPGNPPVWETTKFPFMSVNPQLKPYPAKCEL